jgi:uncharacterized protein (DUF488 family)
MNRKSPVHTIGHSTKTIEEFLSLLKSYDVEKVADIRTIPRSRHNPQFNMDTLAPFLRRKGIGYFHMKGLGGLRHALKDSINMGWQNPSFRGFADYMQTLEFEESLSRLIKMTEKKRVALMCAEAVPWRCHRSLVADALKVRGMEVVHIMSVTSSHPHTLTSFAKVQGKRITYPAG